MKNREMLESAIYDLIFNKKNSFIGAVLNEMNIYFNMSVPTAGLLYNKKKREFQITLNPNFFQNLEQKHRTAVFHHEILHFTHDHIRRFMKDESYVNSSFEEKLRHNIAADMAINQYIKDIPDDGIKVDDWKLPNGKPFPRYKTYEEYYSLLQQTTQQNQEDNSENKEGDPNTDNCINRPTFDKYTSGERTTLDEHNFNESQLTEEEYKQMLEDLKDTFQRAIEKNSFSHSSLPEYIQDLLRELDGAIQGLDYKRILREAIKKHASHSERESTWYRPNKRYGVVAQGTKEGSLPLLKIYMDSSGSVSHREANEFIKVMGNFLKVGARKCDLNLFHTKIYHREKYKKNKQFNHSQIECGGTDLGPVLEDIKKTHPDLSIILTDGYYDGYNIKMNDKVVFIITEQGDINHPLSHYGKTIKYTGLT
jgi:predicted metal-dependent peptidase